MPGIFVSYRRTDTLPWAGRLFDYLARAFGKHQVFMDINGGIPRGANFEKVLAESLTSCDAMLALIGPTWASCTRPDGTPRLSVAGDWVRTEIATSLRRGVPLMPVLLGGATLPEAEAMPEDLRGLSKQQCAKVEDVDWHHHVDSLVRDLAGLTHLTVLRSFDEDDVESVSSGIRLLLDLVLRNHSVASAVGRSKEVIENVYRQVGRLELFKAIHDSLHSIEIECLRPLEVAGGRGNIGPFMFRFGKEARRIKEALQSDDLSPALRDEIDDSLEAVKMAFHAAKEAPGPERTAFLISQLNALISGPPSRLDVAISDVASALDLDRLVDVMGKVRGILGRSVHDASLAGFVQGIDALHRLRDELIQRTQEHSRLQALDSKLRTVCLGGTAARALAPEWVRIKTLRGRLAAPGSKELQAAAEELSELERDLEAALSKRDEETAMELVRDYFRAVGSVFRDVDSGLKEFSMRLTGVSQPMKAILDVLDVP